MLIHGLLALAIGWPCGALAEQPGQLVSPDLKKVWRPAHDRIQEKILARRPVRPPSPATVQRQLADPANQQAGARGRAQLKTLSQAVKAGGARQGVRKGYSGTEVEYSGRGLAAQLGLRPGESTTWSTAASQLEVKAETAGRVVLKVRRHDLVMQALRSSIDKIVARLAADPSAPLSARDELRLALAPADLRAEALADHGFKLDRVEQARSMKYRLEVTGEQQTKIFTRVFGPSVSTYLPGGHHSQYIHAGRIFDPYFNELQNPVRATQRRVYPVNLTVAEATRLDELARAVVSESYTEGVQGRLFASSRPPGYWPPRAGKDCRTGNSCTTTHHRAPIGKRPADQAWLDKLEAAQPDGQPSLLAQISAVTGPQRLQKIDALLQTANGEQRELLTRLRPIVESYNTIGLSLFPLTLLGRAQLKELMGVPYDPTKPGTTDPVGPGMARGMYAGAQQRVPVLVDLRRDPGVPRSAFEW